MNKADWKAFDASMADLGYVRLPSIRERLAVRISRLFRKVGI